MSVTVFNNTHNKFHPLFFGNDYLSNVWKYPKYTYNVTTSQGIVYHENIIDGKKHGYCYGINQKTGLKSFEGIYVNNLREGLCRWYYENGVISFEGEYKGDMKKGFFQSFYEDTKPKSSGFFYNEKRIGLWYFWDERGNISIKYYL